MKETDIVKGERCNIPSKAGIYRFLNKESGKVDYAGQTNNLKRRSQEHSRSGTFNPDTQTIAYSIAKTNATRDELVNTEKEHIKRHNPTSNTYAGGNGRR